MENQRWFPIWIIFLNIFYYFYYSKIKTASYIEIEFRHWIIAILVDEALSFFNERLFGFLLPPVDQITVFVELPSLVVEAMGYFMPNCETNGTVVHVTRAVGVEEDSLQDSSRKFCEIKNI